MQSTFPHPSTCQNPYGIVAKKPLTSSTQLLDSYFNGIFPWFQHDQPYWFSPPERCVLIPTEFRVNKALSKVLRNHRYEVRINHDLALVLSHCATIQRSYLPEGDTSTWLTPLLRGLLLNLHATQTTTCLTVHEPDGTLMGGLYGIRVGQLFCGESMFSLQPNGSKIALAHLCAHAKQLGITLIDCQAPNPHLLSHGARVIPRSDFLTLLAALRPKTPSDMLVAPSWPTSTFPPLTSEQITPHLSTR